MTTEESSFVTSSSLDLTVPEHAYMFGFIQADGHLYETTRNRGRVQIELNETDHVILERFADLIPFRCTVTRRTRKTNFSPEYRSVMLRVYDQRFRESLRSLGLTSGRKSNLVSLPNGSFSRVDYIRGVLDADGSLGMTRNGFPFVSLVTASEYLAGAYLDLILQVTGKSKEPKRNRRDGVFNIVVYKEDAQLVASTLYYRSCLALPRKQAAALSVLAWKRPAHMRRVPIRKRWMPEEDSFILAHTVAESSSALRRTPQSIKMRLWRLTGQ